MKSKKLLCALSFVLTSAMLFPATASAHGVWFASRLDKTQLVLGEGFKDNAYDPNMVTYMQGYDAKYKKTTVEKIDDADHITINPSESTSVVTVGFDYGYWSNDTEGNWHNVPMDEIEGSTVGTHAVKYSVNYLGSVDKVKALPDMLYQIVPSVDPTKLNVGDSFTVQVLYDGKPLPNVDIIPDVINHHTVTQKTDGNGRAKVTVSNGSINVIGMELAVPYEKDDKKATQSKVFTSLSYTIYPEEAD